MFSCNNFFDKVLFGTNYPWSYCGYFESNLDKELSNIYEENIKVFKKLPINTYKKNYNNTMDYLFKK